MPGPEDEVLAVNAAFYAAFESRDMHAMSEIWEHSERISCVHPGWSRLVGSTAVLGSWFALFEGPQQLQFIVTDEATSVDGDTAWITCNENLLDGGRTSTVAATNIFHRSDDGWRLVHHHGSPVLDRRPTRDS